MQMTPPPQPQSSSVQPDKQALVQSGLKGLGSAGLRLGGLKNQTQQQSSGSSRRDAFRNRILSIGPGSLRSFEAFNRFKGDNSSVSSRFVVRLEGNETDADIVSQQEQEYKNEFEKAYDEIETLGEGCSSVVKKCEHKILKQLRAVKIIRNDDQEYIENAQNEYTILKDLNHPSIVKMFDCIHDTEKGTLYLIMEFLEGQTLEDYTLKLLSDKQGNLRESTIQKIFKQIVLAIEYLHE